MSMFPLTARYKLGAESRIALAVGIQQAPNDVATLLILDRSFASSPVQLDVAFEKVVKHIEKAQKKPAPYIDFTEFQRGNALRTLGAPLRSVKNQ